MFQGVIRAILTIFNRSDRLRARPDLRVFAQSNCNQLIMKKQVGPSLVHMLGKKYPNAYLKPAWMFIFPSTGLCQHPYTGITCRHHLHDSVPRKALSKAVGNAGCLIRESAAIPLDIRLLPNC